MRKCNNTRKMSPSKENYLKVILKLANGNDTRLTDIANEMGVSKASVSRMTGILKEERYIDKEDYGSISLTEKGKETAARIKRRYDLIVEFLHDHLGVDYATAKTDACNIEHLICHETMEMIYKKLDQYKNRQSV